MFSVFTQSHHSSSLQAGLFHQCPNESPILRSGNVFQKRNLGIGREHRKHYGPRQANCKMKPTSVRLSPQNYQKYFFNQIFNRKETKLNLLLKDNFSETWMIEFGKKCNWLGFLSNVKLFFCLGLMVENLPPVSSLPVFLL